MKWQIEKKIVLSEFLTIERSVIGLYKIAYIDRVILNYLRAFCYISLIITDNGSGLRCASNYNNNNNNTFNCKWAVARWQWLLCTYVNMKQGSKEFKSGGLHEKQVVATWKPSQHLLIDTGKPRKTFAEVAGRRTFQILTTSQKSGK